MILTAFRGAKAKWSLRGSVKYLPFLGHSTFVFKEKERFGWEAQSWGIRVPPNRSQEVGNSWRRVWDATRGQMETSSSPKRKFCTAWGLLHRWPAEEAAGALSCLQQPHGFTTLTRQQRLHTLLSPSRRGKEGWKGAG